LLHSASISVLFGKYYINILICIITILFIHYYTHRFLADPRAQNSTTSTSTTATTIPITESTTITITTASISAKKIEINLVDKEDNNKGTPPYFC
jgi:hypothetical protein